MVEVVVNLVNVLISYFHKRYQYSLTVLIYTVVEALVAFMSVWSVIGLAGFHSYLVCCNITTNEDVRFLLISAYIMCIKM